MSMKIEVGRGAQEFLRILAEIEKTRTQLTFPQAQKLRDDFRNFAPVPLFVDWGKPAEMQVLRRDGNVTYIGRPA